MSNEAKYIEFGSRSDRVWIIDMNLENHLDKALRVRGYANVTWGKALSGVVPEDVWQENRYLPTDGLTKEPQTVFFLMWRSHPLRQAQPIAASASQEVTDKVAEAMRLSYPQWEYETKAQERPE